MGDRSVIGSKIQDKILAYISDNNMIPAKEFKRRPNKYKPKRKKQVRMELTTIDELSNESGSVLAPMREREVPIGRSKFQKRDVDSGSETREEDFQSNRNN